MSRLNKTQNYAINWLHSQNKSVDDIATELGLNVEQVSKSLEKASTNKPVKTGSEPVAQSKPDLMINKTAGKGNSGVSIMTREASERNDAVRSKTTINNLRSDAIHRPKK
jgi:hypothetical protein